MVMVHSFHWSAIVYPFENRDDGKGDPNQFENYIQVVLTFCLETEVLGKEIPENQYQDVLL